MISDFGILPIKTSLISLFVVRRISNFMLWHAAYSEIEFSDILWPDFDYKHLERSINQLNLRERRFGGLKNDSERLAQNLDNQGNKTA